MGYQVIKQPNDLYAIFSTFTDTIIVWDASETEIEGWFVEGAAERAREQIRKDLKHIASGEPRHVYHQFALTWQEALEMDQGHGGEVWNHPDCPRGEP